MEDIVREHRKNHAYESVSIKPAETCPMHINFTAPRTWYNNSRIGIILQFLVDSFSFYFSVFELES